MPQVSEVPKVTVRAAKIVAGNAMLMAAAEIVIEVLVLVGAHPTSVPAHIHAPVLNMLHHPAHFPTYYCALLLPKNTSK